MTVSTHSRPRAAIHCPGGAVGDGGAAAGLVTLAAPATVSASSTGRRSINVPRDFPAIQAALDAAAPGATIHVGPGTYTEQILITKDGDLSGAGAAATVIQTLATLVPLGVFLPTGAPVAAVVRVGSGARAHLGPGGERTASVYEGRRGPRDPGDRHPDRRHERRSGPGELSASLGTLARARMWRRVF